MKCMLHSRISVVCDPKSNHGFGKKILTSIKTSIIIATEILVSQGFPAQIAESFKNLRREYKDFFDNLKIKVITSVTHTDSQVFCTFDIKSGY